MTAKEDLDKLYSEYEADPELAHLRADDIQLVKGTGILGPPAMIIGEAPSAIENAQGVPFVGNAGQELIKILKIVNISQADLYMTNIVKYWTRTEDRTVRTPTLEEIQASKPYLLREIEIVDPDYVALLGRSAITAFYPNVRNVGAVNGRLLDTKYLPLFHPGVCLYKPEKKQEVIDGYRVLADLLKGL